MRVIALITLQLYLADGFLRRPTATPYKSDDGDPGEPLFLTPYIEAGKIDEARRLARVTLPDVPNIESYCGFFTVNKTYNSNQFLWYFPPTKLDNSTGAPVILWLQGGPGASSLYGLFEENGPIYVQSINGTLKFQPRQYHWAEKYHLIYIDNPVGAGFSFTNDSRGYCTDQTQVGDQLYTTLIQFFQLFPELQNNKFCISGESYAGKYIPALGYTIHYMNPTAKIKINLYRMFIGNGWCDPINQVEYLKTFYQLGLITDKFSMDILKSMEWNMTQQIEQEKWTEAANLFQDMLSFTQTLTDTISYYNFLNDFTDPVVDYASLISNSQSRKAIHVGGIDFNEQSLDVYNYLKEDMMKSIAPWITELLSYYMIYFYNGQLDIMVAYPHTVNFLRKLNYPASKQYNMAKRYNFFLNSNIMGYLKGAGKMGECMIINAGHMVPKDQPLVTKLLIESFMQPPPWNGIEFEDELKIGNNEALVIRKPPKIENFDFE